MLTTTSLIHPSRREFSRAPTRRSLFSPPLAQLHEESVVLVGVRDFVRAVFGFPSAVGDAFIFRDNAAAEILFHVGIEGIARIEIRAAAEGVEVDDDRPHFAAQHLQLHESRLSEDDDGIGLEQRKRIELHQLAALGDIPEHEFSRIGGHRNAHAFDRRTRWDVLPRLGKCRAGEEGAEYQYSSCKSITGAITYAHNLIFT